MQLVADTETYINRKMNHKINRKINHKIIMAALGRQVEIDILKVLSGFIPRNQSEITKAIGKSNKKSTDRVQIHRAIRRTAKYYARSMPRMEDSGKLWVLRKELETIGQIVTDYPELFSHFQSHDIVLGMLIDKHVNQVCTDEWLSDVQELDFKSRLMKSATFFRLYLFEHPAELLKIIETLFSITERGQEFERLNRGEIEEKPKPPPDLIEKYGFAAYKPSFNDMLDVTFSTCVGADILYHKECKAGIELIKNIKTPTGQ